MMISILHSSMNCNNHEKGLHWWTKKQESFGSKHLYQDTFLVETTGQR